MSQIGWRHDEHVLLVATGSLYAATAELETLRAAVTANWTARERWFTTLSNAKTDEG